MDKTVEEIVTLALKEDIRNGDITTQAVYNGDEIASGTFVAKEAGIVAGIELAEYIYTRVDPEIRLIAHLNDGDTVSRGDFIAEVKGPADSILTGERTVLNFMQRMSGVATKTSLFVQELEGSNTRILDTRKTLPGHRYLDKWAVRLGGGKNHRYCLDDMYLIKDNHIAVAGGVKQAIRAIQRHRQVNNFTWKIEVEVATLDQLKDALEEGGIDFVLLDNMDNAQLAEAVILVDGRIKTEASGNMTLDRLRSVAKTGVDFISVGEITHSVKALDISLLFD